MLSEALRAVAKLSRAPRGGLGGAGAASRRAGLGSRWAACQWCWLLPRAVESAQKPRLKAEAAARRKPRRAVGAAPEAGSCAAPLRIWNPQKV